MADWGTKIKMIMAQGFYLKMLSLLKGAVCRSMHSIVLFGYEHILLGTGAE
jgi:hypothetical protein